MSLLRVPESSVDTWIICEECDSYQGSFLPSRSTAWCSPGRRRRKDQEASKNPIFPEEVAAHHVGHLHGRQGARGQQQRLCPRSQSQPAQVHFGRVSPWRELGQRAQRHAGLNSDPLRRIQKDEMPETDLVPVSLVWISNRKLRSVSWTVENDRVQ